MKDWSQHKSSMPGGSMPVIEFPDGTKMGQTCSLARYLGNINGLEPTDAYEKWINGAWIEDFND